MRMNKRRCGGPVKRRLLSAAGITLSCFSPGRTSHRTPALHPLPESVHEKTQNSCKGSSWCLNTSILLPNENSPPVIRVHIPSDPRGQLLGRADLAAQAGASLCSSTSPKATLGFPIHRKEKVEPQPHSRGDQTQRAPGTIRTVSVGSKSCKNILGCASREPSLKSPSMPILPPQIMSLLVVVVVLGRSVPLGGRACAKMKLTQSSRSEQECSILDLEESKAKDKIFRSNQYYGFFVSWQEEAKRKSNICLKFRCIVLYSPIALALNVQF